MDTDGVNAELANLQQQIQTVGSVGLGYENEVERRRLWRDLEILKMSIDDSTKQITSEAREVRLFRFFHFYFVSFHHFTIHCIPIILFLTCLHSIHQSFKTTYPELAKMLTLRPFAKRSGGIRGAVAFVAFFFMTTMMFPAFLVTFPLSWLVRILSVTKRTRYEEAYYMKLGFNGNNRSNHFHFIIFQKQEKVC
jgi:hypothetical protein